ncbi:His/Gly/Thr/Pro-type tRNA ligase C-terminal domain-containing protein, partial [Dehalococcoidales bacterium]|nr:His/Gly/Thr/Pro-type tRNA ligase C-terminal domain-containing protein [Dehalococcoidales bacterium]
RYDDLIEELGGKPTPGIGFAAGIERIILNLKRQNVPIPPLPRPKVFVAHIGDETKDEAIKLAATIRKNGISVIKALGSKSLKAQLRQANSLGAGYAVIIGDQEIKTGTVILRDMTTGQQKTIPLTQLQGLIE